MQIKAKALPFIRSAVNLDQSALARKVGVTQSMISAVEKGKRPLSGGLERKIRREINLNDEMIVHLTDLYWEISNQKKQQQIKS